MVLTIENIIMEKWKKRILMNALGKKKGDKKMAQSDDLEFERIITIAKGFGWQVLKQEIKDMTLELVLEKRRVEPETDITLQPT